MTTSNEKSWIQERGPGKISVAVIVVLVTVGAIWAAWKVQIPMKGGAPDLPAIALGQKMIYRFEIGAVVFYGALLIITPLFRGIVHGTLPTEISARGAKFADSLDNSLKDTQQILDDHRKELDDIKVFNLETRVKVDEIEGTTIRKEKRDGSENDE